MFSGARLRQARAEAQTGGLSAEELAERVGASKAQILAYENGQRVPDPPRIRQLAAALEIRPLELADQERMADWDLAELRRANGLRASDLCRELELKPHSYRRLERTGLSPESRYGMAVRLAGALGVSVQVLERHIANVPGVRQRLDQVREALTTLVGTHLAPGRADVPDPEDEAVKAVAVQYARSPSTVARILQQQIVTLREMHHRQATEAAAAYYGATPEDQDRARRRMENEAVRIQQLIATLPQRMDAFFRAQLSPHGWETLGQLHLARSDQAALAAARSTLFYEPLLAPFIRTQSIPQGAGRNTPYVLSRDAQRHYAAYKSWYGALYPWVEESLRQFEARLEAGEPSGQAWLRRCFAQSQTVLFSFDGVLCRLFADNVRSVSVHLTQAAHSLELGTDPVGSTDPVAVLRSVVDHGSPEQIRALDGILTSYETEAARRAEPLPGAAQLLGVLSQGPWRIAVVTDHASAAVQAFLTHLRPDAGGAPSLDVFGRPTDPRLMKPHPHAVSLATSVLGGDRSRTVLIGESLADALAARAAGVQFIGVAAQRSQARRLKEAGAVNVVDTLTTLIAAVSKLNGTRW
ncbi:helix-turn-helix domain-containing protein [Streptomyces sp. BK205]|uniref:helix-turn-helix domain-containing protein n=1 Tax=Streptomyces sp. BK205 TaxID=2512164 RepID=UPI0014045E6B|nr:helix-turn-helix domain-containing protein [Streptomyces sp. BK205]